MRRHPRQECSIECQVVGQREVTTGTVTNISMGGVAVQVPLWDRSEEVVLRFTIEDEPMSLTCTLRGAQRLWGTTILNLSFAGLTRPEVEALERLMESLQEANSAEAS